MNIDINILNEQQNIYTIKRRIDIASRNFLFEAIKRSCQNQFLNVTNLDNQAPIETFILKLYPFYNKEHKENYDREQEIINLFYGNPEIIKYQRNIVIKYEGRDYILIPMIYYPNNDLLTYLCTNLHSKTIENYICTATYEALKILKILKDENVVHNDIKFENFLVESTNPLKIILTDFESSIKLQINAKTRESDGTIIYQSPEVLRGDPHDYSSDLWSLGVNVYLFLYNEYPFSIRDSDISNDKEESKKNILSKIEQNEVWRLDFSISEEAYQFVSNILQIDPEDRPSVENALNDPWFLSIEYQNTKHTVCQIEDNIEFGDEIVQPKY